MKWSDYLYPDTDVLINKKGIKEQQWLDLYEGQATRNRQQELSDNPIQGHYDLDHLKKIHAHVFQDVYAWAGQVREVGIAKRYVDFVEPDKIDEQAQSALSELKDNHYLKGLGKAEFIQRFSNTYGKLNDIHPFREGNGRALQVFMQDIARKAGYDVRFDEVDRDDWNHACMYNRYDNSGTELNKRGGERKNRELENIFTHIVKPLAIEQTQSLDSTAETIADNHLNEAAWLKAAALYTEGKFDNPQQREELLKRLNEGMQQRIRQGEAVAPVNVKTEQQEYDQEYNNEIELTR